MAETKRWKITRRVRAGLATKTSPSVPSVKSVAFNCRIRVHPGFAAAVLLPLESRLFHSDLLTDHEP
jgi:hypothetical protein